MKDGFKFKIGRDDGCHIKINNQTLGDRHSEIMYKDGNFQFRNKSQKYVSWLRLSPKSLPSQNFKIDVGDIFRLSSRKSFLIEGIVNSFEKNKT